MMIKDSTKRKIDQAVAKTLKEAGMREPPFLIEDLLGHLELDREFYDLEDPDFQEALEADANCGASGLMFGGKVFTRDALDTNPEWESIDGF
jgi:hypothetical protein